MHREIAPARSLLFTLALVALAGCDCGSVKPVETFLAAAPTELSFGWVRVDGEGEASFQLQNPGRTPATAALEVEGDAFTMAVETISLEPLSEATVAVVFRPLTAGEHAGRVKLVAGSWRGEVRLLGRARACAESLGCGTQQLDPATGQCTFVSGCDDGNACTADRCNAASGACVHADISDRCPAPEEACRIAACDPEVGCVAIDAPDGTACGAGCEAGTCHAGACVSTFCDDANACTLDTCDVDSGQCLHTAARSCDDDNACTADRCDALTGACVHEDAASACPDVAAECHAPSCDPVIGCTSAPVADGTSCGGGCGAGACSNGVCVPSVCDDANACTRDHCEDSGATCWHEDIEPLCVPANECMEAHCDPAQGCIQTPMPEGSNCGSGCGAGQCVSGACVSRQCDDQNACTRDSCNAALDECVHEDMSSQCPGARNSCLQTCDPAIGCVQTPLEDGHPCGVATCLVSPECRSGQCIATPAPAAGACGCDETLASPPRIASFGGHTCRITPAGDVECWGMNVLGRLGTGDTTPSPVPVAVPGLSDVEGVAVHGGGSYAWQADGGSYWWGQTVPQANGSALAEHSPVAIPGFSRVREGATSGSGVFTTCLWAEDGIWCTGGNDYGQHGNGSVTFGWGFSSVWRKVPLEGVQAASFFAGSMCAVLPDLGLRCWGQNRFGSLGLGPATHSNIARPTAARTEDGGFLRGVVEVSTAAPTCVRTMYGEIYCAGEVHNAPVPVLPWDPAISGPSAVFTSPWFTRMPINGCAQQVSSGWSTACVTLAGGTVECFGENGYGRLGDPDAGVTWSNASGLTGVTEVSVGRVFTCAALDDGGFRCWGSQQPTHTPGPFMGVLGDGTGQSRWTP